MQRAVKLPDIGEGTTEAEIVSWLVKIGDIVEEDDPLAEVMTDKATVEIPSPAAGTVVSLGGKVGEKLAVGSDLVVLETHSEAAHPHPPAAAAASLPSPQAGEGREALVQTLSPAVRERVVRRKAASRVRVNPSPRRRCATGRATWASTCA